MSQSSNSGQSAALPTPAQVYRDAQGVPHITSVSEPAAWYALGYEQARDGLLWIQYACKAAKGELTWVRGDLPGLQNDITVRVLGAHLGGKTPAQLRSLLSPVGSGISGNFYDNCVAFTAGANAYRLLVSNAPATPSTPERDLRNWLDTHRIGPAGQSSFAWVYTQPIDVVDIASQGGWTSAVWSLFPFRYSVVNSSGPSYTLQAGSGAAEDPGLVVDPLSPGTNERLLEELRAHVSHLPGAPSAMSGSNSFAWSGLYCKDPSTGVTYPGLLADPHQGLPFFGSSFADQFGKVPNHMWFAHVQVTPSGAQQPTLDIFGHVPYAAASFQSGHNRHVAMGGTAGSPNHTDRFVLRLREDPTTHGPWISPNTVNGAQFYSYYHDTGGTNTTYQDVTESTIDIKRPDDSVVPVPYWRAQSFGFILPDFGRTAAYVVSGDPLDAPTLADVVVYGERVETNQSAPPWRARVANTDNPNRQPLPKNRFWKSPQSNATGPITSPMVVTVRAPMDSAVAGNPLVNPATPGEERHWQLLRDFWEISHASSVLDVIPRTNGGALNVNICFVDSGGATFQTQLSAIPKRGDDNLLRGALYSSLDKYLIYSGGAGPVPARHVDDKKFDWRFTDQTTTPARPAGLQYLEYPASWTLPTPATNVTSLKPATLQLPTVPSAFPPVNAHGTGALFSIESGFFTSAVNDNVWGYSRKRDAIPWSTNNGYAWVDLNSDNWLLQRCLEAGTVYQTSGLAFEGPDRQQIVVERFTRRAQELFRPSDPQVLPSLTPAEMREFVVTPRLHANLDYAPPLGAAANASLPTEIRQLKEVIQNPGYQEDPLDPAKAADPVLRASRELQFFSDFWTHLNGTAWNNHTVQPGLQVNLRALWVGGGDPNQPAHTDQIFYYDHSGVAQWIDMPPAFPLIDFAWQDSELGSGFATGAAASAASPVGDLATATMLVGNLVAWESAPAPDLYKMRQSSPGACLLEMMRMGYNAQDVYSRKWRRLNRGVPVAALERTKWETLRGLAFPGSQYASLLRGGLNPPYQALYVNGPGSSVKATLAPQDINDLVRFFLELGGHYINPDDNLGNPSRKLARWQIANSDVATFLTLLPGNYPLTGGLERITVLRRLLDAYAFLNSSSPPFGLYFRSRAYDHNGQQLFPDATLGTDRGCVGAALRSVVWNEEPPGTPGHVRFRGFQPKFLGMSGSYATLLSLFPSSGGVESYFWCTPGVQAMGYDLRGPAETQRRFDLHMDAFATNTLMRSHYSDFLTNAVTTVVHYY